MRTIILLFLISFLTHQFSFANNTLDSLYEHSDIVLSGNLLKVSGGVSEDLGTITYYVQLQVDSIYKQKIRVQSGEMSLNWQVSHLYCKRETLKACIEKYSRGKWIFFLKQDQILGTNVIEDDRIIPYTNEKGAKLRSIEFNHKRLVDHYYRHKTCKPDCVLCNAIENENWSGVKKYLIKQVKGHQHDTLLNHRRVKWAFSYRSINASMPSSTGTFFLFNSAHREVHAYAGYQVGYFRHYSPWLSFLLYKIVGNKAYHKLRRENTDTMILKSFVVDSNYSDRMIYYEKLNCNNMLTDTLKQALYPQRMSLSGELCLLELVYEDELRLYLDHQTMPDYLPHASGYIQKEKEMKHVYLLSMITTHTVPEIAIESMRALKELDDARCIPFLIELAKFKSAQGINQTVLSDQHDEYVRVLIETLDSLCRCHTQAQSVPMGVSGLLFDMSLSIPLWESSIRMKE